MSYYEYEKQLEQVNIAIQNSSGQEREELLSLKSSIEELLSLTNEPDVPECETTTQPSIDDEYSLFMSEINDVPSTSKSEIETDITDEEINELKVLEGKKCKAPHVNKWGSKGYHNALICSIVKTKGDDGDIQLQAKVLYTNPTHEEMLPCPYYFDTDCKFSEDKCKYSHGEIVLVSDLQEYTEPDFASLRIGSQILAKQNNKLWGRGKITRIFEKTCQVKFESVKKETELPFEEILPLDGNEQEEENENSDLEVDQDVVNMSLLNTPSEGPLGDWEKFTRGIGSKLMQKMGYIVGTGLGKKCDGRLDPVTAVILPAGKSLDHCMYLREKSGGDKNLFSAERKLKKLQRKEEIRSQKIYEKEKSEKNVFQFLNNTLSSKKEEEKIPLSASQHRKHIKSESSRSLNVASLKSDEDIRKVERNVSIIKESLKRHTDRNSQMHKSLQQKLDATLDELSSLKNQAQNIRNEQNLRKDKKKMTIF